jgi:hypothetical protein
MSEQDQSGEQEPLLRQDPLVERLLSDPSEENLNVDVLTGFLGNSTQEEYVRLYLTPALDVYLEIPRRAVVQSHSLVSELNPLGGTVLWVKQDADIVLHTRTNLRQRQAQFLGGTINTTGSSQADVQGMTSAEAAAFAAAGQGGVRPARTLWGGGVTWVCCPFYTGHACMSRLACAPTAAFACAPTVAC